MPSTDDLKTHAASNHDFYALLDISPAASEAEIRRAYRRTALKYHPDKLKNPTSADLDKFHLLQIANDVLSDSAIRQLYDNAREARERKKREHEMMDAAKRKMKEDLEARERAGAAAIGGAQRGMKRSWASAGGYDDAEEKLQREIERIAEDGRRRRREEEERRRQKVAEDERHKQEEEKEAQRAADKSAQRVDRSQEGGTNVPEQERAVKVRWVREGRGEDIDKDRLISLFSPCGKIESVLILKDRRQRLGDKREKKTVATGVVVFASIVSAHTAILDSERMRRESIEQLDNDWNLVESVFWATGNLPDLETGTNDRSASPTPNQGTTPSKPEQATSASPHKPSFNFAGLKSGIGLGGKQGKIPPSFNSFSTAATGDSKPTSTRSLNGGNTLSLEEVTLMRLKNAQREKERKALEEKLRKEDEVADAAEEGTA